MGENGDGFLSIAVKYCAVCGPLPVAGSSRIPMHSRSSHVSSYILSERTVEATATMPTPVKAIAVVGSLFLSNIEESPASALKSEGSLIPLIIDLTAETLGTCIDRSFSTVFCTSFLIESELGMVGS